MTGEIDWAEARVIAEREARRVGRGLGPAATDAMAAAALVGVWEATTRAGWSARYAAGAARNAARDEMRWLLGRRRPWPASLDAIREAGFEPAAPESGGGPTAAERAAALLARLGDDDRAMVAARFGVGRPAPASLDALAAAHGLTRDAVRWRVETALASLAGDGRPVAPVRLGIGRGGRSPLSRAAKRATLAARRRGLRRDSAAYCGATEAGDATLRSRLVAWLARVEPRLAARSAGTRSVAEGDDRRASA